MHPVDPRIPPNAVPIGSKPLVFGEGQRQYRPLPAIVTPSGDIITRWEPTLEDRKRIVQGEDIFLTIRTFGRVPIAPVLVTVGAADWKEM